MTSTILQKLFRVIAFSLSAILLIPPNSYALTQATAISNDSIKARQSGDLTKTQTMSDYDFEPIRLAVPESELSPKHLEIKDELIDHSQSFEREIHMNGIVDRNKELEERIKGLLSPDIMGEKAQGFYFRVYVLKSAAVNAMALPSGSIYIHSGLLAILDNFDQLRAVLAHEAHHILDQDVVYKYKKMRQEVGTIKVLKLIAAPLVGVAIVETGSDTGRTIAHVYQASSTVLGLAYNLSFSGYGRSNETECDLYALETLHQQGHSVLDMKSVFSVFADQKDKFGKGFQSHLFASHETGRMRAKRVEDFIKNNNISPTVASTEIDLEYYRLTKELRLTNAKINIINRRIQHALDDLDRLDKVFPDEKDILYLKGEAYSVLSEYPEALRNELSFKSWREYKIRDLKKQQDIWSKDAQKYFRQAIAQDATYADPYRGLALLQEVNEEYKASLQNFESYIDLKPKAEDKRFIKAKIKRLKKIILKRDTEEVNKKRG